MQWHKLYSSCCVTIATVSRIFPPSQTETARAKQFLPVPPACSPQSPPLHPVSVDLPALAPHPDGITQCLSFCCWLSLSTVPAGQHVSGLRSFSRPRISLLVVASLLLGVERMWRAGIRVRLLAEGARRASLWSPEMLTETLLSDLPDRVHVPGAWCQLSTGLWEGKTSPW